MKRATELLEAAHGGSESVYRIEAGPGMGKTALMQRIVERCRQREFVVLNGSFVDGQDLPPLWPWRRILAKVRKVTGLDSSEFAEKHQRLFKAIEYSWDDIEELRALPATDRKFRFFEMIGACLEDLARISPVALVLDDLHTGDDLSLHLLQYLLDALELSPVFALLSWRPGEGGGAERIARLKEKIYYLPNAEATMLEPFGREEVRRVLASYSLEPSDAEADHLLDWTKGRHFRFGSTPSGFARFPWRNRVGLRALDRPCRRANPSYNHLCHRLRALPFRASRTASEGSSPAM